MALNKYFNVFLKQKRRYRDLLCWIVLFIFIFLYGCADLHVLERRLTLPTQVQSLDSNSPFLKAHMHDGKVYILSSWQVDSENQAVTGQGEVLNVNREILETGEFTIPVDSVAIFETNTVDIPPEIQEKATITACAIGCAVGVPLSIAIYCAANPKACFGSCPTFYVSDGNQSVLQAEGFSASVAPALEASDIDALYHAPTN